MANEIKVIRAQGMLIEAFKLSGLDRDRAMLQVLEMLKGIGEN